MGRAALAGNLDGCGASWLAGWMAGIGVAGLQVAASIGRSLSAWLNSLRDDGESDTQTLGELEARESGARLEWPWK